MGAVRRAGEAAEVQSELRTRGCSWGCTGVFVVWLLLMAVDCIPLTRLAMRWEQNSRVERVGAKIPGMFPVLVATPLGADSAPEAEIVFHEHLRQYLNKHPGVRFTVALGQVKRLNEDLKRVHWAGRAYGGFEVKQLPGGRQRFKVNGSSDDDRANIGWYDASATRIEPKRYVTYFFPRLVYRYMAVVALLNAVVAAVIVIPLERFSASRRRSPNS